MARGPGLGPLVADSGGGGEADNFGVECSTGTVQECAPRYMRELFEKTFAEFFAGIGLMRIGLERGGVSGPTMVTTAGMGR
jgi:hypothetical protein